METGFIDSSPVVYIFTVLFEKVTLLCVAWVTLTDFTPTDDTVTKWQFESGGHC